VPFRYSIHRKILQILEAVNHDFFQECSALFGGGTMLALAYGEYRLSRDIDFLCPYGAAFSHLRRGVFERGYEALFDLDKCHEISFPRDIRTDRDGVRFAIQSGETILKFEIVAEGRITFEPPSQPQWSPVACLGLVDQIAEKLLATGDRWADSSIYSRDLIDLAILKQKTTFPNAALAKAEAAYPTIEPLKRAIQAFQSKPDYRLQCYERLQIETPATVIDGLDLLAAQFELPPCPRNSLEVA
jgi:hypothetical protein